MQEVIRRGGGGDQRFSGIVNRDRLLLTLGMMKIF
jgi:hypothetical protein